MKETFWHASRHLPEKLDPGTGGAIEKCGVIGVEPTRWAETIVSKQCPISLGN